MQLHNIEVMRAHRTNVNQRATEANTSTVRPIHIYLLRYSDKVQILKAVANALKDNPFLDSQIFISDDVSKNVRKDRAKLQKDYLKGIKKEAMSNLHSNLGQYWHKFCSFKLPDE